MNKTLTGMIVLGATAALLAPVAPAWASGGNDDSSGSHSGRDRDHNRDDDSTDDNGIDDGTDDNGTDDSADDNSTDDNGTDDSGADSPGDDDGTADQGRGDRGQGTADRARGKARGKDGRVEVRESGTCSDSSRWRMRIRVRDDRGRIKFQVKTGTAGQEWSYQVVDNGTEILSGTKVTHGRSADFNVKRKWRGVPAGPHAVTATAQNLQTGETCSANANA